MSRKLRDESRDPLLSLFSATTPLLHPLIPSYRLPFSDNSIVFKAPPDKLSRTQTALFDKEFLSFDSNTNLFSLLYEKQLLQLVAQLHAR